MGSGAWFSLGALAMTNRDVPVGVLPSLWLLALLVALSTALVATLRTMTPTLALLPSLGALGWFGISSLPAAFVWTGPFVLAIWALLLTAIGESRRWPASLVNSRTLVAVVAAVVVSAFAVGHWQPVRPIGGDEPHYLLIAQSILLDGDVDLANDYDIARHGAFYPGELRHHTVVTLDGNEYSFHGLGTGVLAVPGFLIGGLTGVRVWFLIIALAGVISFWIAAQELTHSGAAAWSATGALLLQLPFLAQATSIYPDGPAAAVTSFVLLTLVRLEQHGRVAPAWLIASATLLSALPWLQIRLVVVAAFFGLAISWGLWRRGRPGDILVFLAVPVVAAVFLFASTYVMFATLDPTAPFRTAAAGSLRGVPAGVFGLLLDHEYGLLMYAPAFAFTIAGWRRFYTTAPLTSAVCAAAVLITLILGAAFVWWGGASSPARFLVPVLPALALSLAAWWSDAPPRARSIAAALIALGATIAVLTAGAEAGRYITNNPDGHSTIFEWANRIVDISAAMPSLFRPGATLASELLLTAVWILTAIAVFRSARRVPVAWCVTAWLTISIVIGWTLRSVDPLTENRAQIAVVRAATSRFLNTPWMDGHTTSSIDAMLPTLAIEGRTGEQANTLLEISDLPAGRYRLEITRSHPTGTDSTRVSVRIGLSETDLWSWPIGDHPGAFDITLPVAVHSLRVVASTGLRDDTRTALRPFALRRPAAGEDFRADQAVRSRSALLFVQDIAPVEIEGFWVRAGRPVSAACWAVDGETPCSALTVEAAAQPTEVRLRRGDWTQSISLAPGEIKRVELPAQFPERPLMFDASGPASRTPAFLVKGPSE